MSGEDFLVKAKRLERRLLEAKTPNDRVDAFASVLRNSNTSSSSLSPSAGDRSESLENVRPPPAKHNNVPHSLRSSTIQIPVAVNARHPKRVMDEAADPVDPFPLVVGVTGAGATAEKERRSMQRTVAKVASHLRSKHLLDSKELMVPCDTSTEVFNRGLNLHQTLCSASCRTVERGRGRLVERRTNDECAVSEPPFPGVAFYRGVNERRPEWAEALYTSTTNLHIREDLNVADKLPWFALSPIVRMEAPLSASVRRTMQTPEKEIRKGERVCRTPPSRPISSTPVLSPALRTRPGSELCREEEVAKAEERSVTPVRPRSDIADHQEHHQLDVKIRELLERSGKKLREVREIINKSSEVEDSLLQLQAGEEAERASRSRMEKSTVSTRNGRWYLSERHQNALPLSSPPSASAVNAVSKAKRPRSREADNSMAWSGSSDHAAKEQLKAAIRERTDATKELARAQLYLTEEERLNSTNPDNASKLRQKGAKLVEEYRQKKARLKAQLRTDLSDDDIKKLVAEHHLATRVLHSDTLATQKKIGKLRERRLLPGLIDRAVQVPTSRESARHSKSNPFVVPRTRLAHRQSAAPEKSLIPTRAAPKSDKLRSVCHPREITRPFQTFQKASLLPIADRPSTHAPVHAPVEAAAVVPRLDLHNLSLSTYHSSQYASGSETSKLQWKEEGERPAYAPSSHFDGQLEERETGALVLAKPPDSAKTSEGVSSIRDEFALLDDDVSRVEWVPAERALGASSRNGRDEFDVLPLEGVDVDSTPMEWVAAADVVRSERWAVSASLSTGQIKVASGGLGEKGDSVRCTDNDVSPLLTDPIPTSLLPLGSLVSPTTEPPRAMKSESREAAVDYGAPSNEKEEVEERDEGGSSPPPFSELDSTFETADDGMGGEGTEADVDSNEEDKLREDEAPHESIEECIAGAEEHSFANEVIVDDDGSASILTPKAESRRPIETEKVPLMEIATPLEPSSASISEEIEAGPEHQTSQASENTREGGEEAPSSSSASSPSYHSSSETPINSTPSVDKTGIERDNDGHAVPPIPPETTPTMSAVGDATSGNISEEISTAKASSSRQSAGSVPVQASSSLADETQKSPTDISALMSKLNISSASSTRDSTPRVSAAHSRSASSRTPRSPTERYMTKYPASTSPRLLNAPNKGTGRVKKARNHVDKAKARSADYLFACSSDDDSTSSVKMLDELPNISSLTPILDISKNSLESPLRNSLSNANAISAGKEGVILSPPAAVRWLATGLAEGEEIKSVLVSPEHVAPTSKREEEKEETDCEEEFEEPPNLRDVDNVRRIVERESTKIWQRLSRGISAEAMYPSALESPEHLAGSSAYERDFNLMIRDWCWELIQADLAVAGRGNRVPQHQVFTSESQLRSRLEGDVLPTICLTSPRSPAGRVGNGEVEVARCHRHAIKIRAERTSHLQLDERRLLAVQPLYDEGWLAGELKGADLAVCEHLITLDDDEV